MKKDAQEVMNDSSIAAEVINSDLFSTRSKTDQQRRYEAFRNTTRNANQNSRAKLISSFSDEVSSPKDISNVSIFSSSKCVLTEVPAPQKTCFTSSVSPSTSSFNQIPSTLTTNSLSSVPSLSTSASPTSTSLLPETVYQESLDGPLEQETSGGINGFSSKKNSNASIRCAVPVDGNSTVRRIFRKKRKREVLYLSCHALLYVISIVFVYFLIKEFIVVPPHVRKTSVCTTPDCIRAASRILDKMDRTTLPCENFYQFTCGNYLKSNVVPEDFPYRSAMQEMQEDVLVIIKKMLDMSGKVNETAAVGKAKRLFHSCMNTSFTVHEKDMADSPIFDLLTNEELGTWPILTQDWNESQFDLERILAHLTIYQVNTFFDSYVTPDERNSTAYTLQFFKGSPALARNYYLNASNEEYSGYLSAYRALIEETLSALSIGMDFNTSEIDDLIAFETKFAVISDIKGCISSGDNGTSGTKNLTEILAEVLNDDDESGRMTVAELEVFIPDIKWGIMLRHIINRFELDLDVDSLVVTLHCNAFVPDLVELLSLTPKRVIVNYLLWRFILRYLPFISNYFQQLWQHFRTEVPDPFDDRNTYLTRWKECAAVVNDGFGAALAKSYVDNFYDLEITEEIDAMVEEVRSAFRSVILRQDWLEPEMKKVCTDKLDMMGKKIGFPEYIQSTEALDEEFEGLEILEDHFLNNILRMKRYEVKKELQKLSRPVDKKKDWLIQPLIVNAFHNPTANEIILPLGILREPFFHPKYPKYVNYGSLGVVVGHELVHGFDNHGKKYDKHGNLSQWWSEKMAEQFQERAACFVDQYSQYPIEMIGKNVDGNETLGDNICDNTGIVNAWLAYENWTKKNKPEQLLPGMNYTIPQIFFIAFGQIWCEVVSREGYEEYGTDMHSPGIHRTNGVVQNLKLFSDIWECPLGSPMNPEKKCYLWV